MHFRRQSEAEVDDKMSGELEAAEPNLTKRPYQKPQFRFERVFETQALTCGKVQSTQGSCHSNRKNS
jgi:hypothetical protein